MHRFIQSSLLLGLFAATSAMANPNEGHFRITVTNVTAGNVLSPFVATALTRTASLFSVGTPATSGLARLAETGDASELKEELQERPSTLALNQAGGGPILAGQSQSVDLVVDGEALKQGAYLQIAAMIGRSNDSFIALDPINLLALTPGGKLRLEARNYDAGSEENTGDVEDFGTGGHPTAAAEGRVTFDRGLNPRGDAPEILAWPAVAALVTVERL